MAKSFAQDVSEVFREAVKQAQKETHAAGLPNVYCHGKNHLKYVYPDDRVRIKKIEQTTTP